MSRRSRIALLIAGSGGGFMLVLAIAAIFILRSQWFHNQVRERVVQEVEKSTGGRVESGPFLFDWKHLRVQVKNFVIHGTEPPGKPPLFQASSISLGLKIVSIFKKEVDIESLEVERPRIFLIIYSDGHTNVPEPRIKRISSKTTMETILDLAVRHFTLENGSFEVEGRVQIPFEAKGDNLHAKFAYALLPRRYQGEIGVAPLVVTSNKYRPVPLEVRILLGLEQNRIQVSAARLVTGKSQLELSGVVEQLVSPRGSFQYNARLDVNQLGRTIELPALQGGVVQAAGNAQFAGSSDYSATGYLQARNVAVREGNFRLWDLQTDSALSVGPRGVDLKGIRVSALVLAPAGREKEPERVPLEGRIEKLTLRQSNLDADGIRLSALGGSFTGRAELKQFERFRVDGSLRDFEVRSVVRLYSRQPVPWGGHVSGPLVAEGSLRRGNAFRVSTRLTVSPAASGVPVTGLITADYDARRDILDLGRSFVSLPSTRLDFSGALGRQLQVHLESRNLDDLWPLLEPTSSAGPPSLPIGLRNGLASFDGTVNGPLDNPRIAGRASVIRFAYAEILFDAFQAEMTAAKSGISFQNGRLTRGILQAQFAGSVSFQQWKVEDSSPVSANALIRNADVADLMALVGEKNVPLAGTLNTTAQVTGTAGNPRISADLELTQGSIYEEPFERLEAKLNYVGGTVELGAAQLVAGQKQITGQVSYDRTPGDFQKGRLRFQMSSNNMALDQFQIIAKAHPEVKGAMQLTAAGVLDLTRSKAGQISFRIAQLQGAMAVRGLELSGQRLGDAHLTAHSNGSVLSAELDSDFANAAIRGSGQWRLVDDSPGTVKVTFSRLDFTRLRQWLAAGKSSGAPQISGTAEGELAFDGPALKPELWKGWLRIPQFQLGLAPDNELNRQEFALHNSGPLVLTMERGVVHVDGARLLGRGTDLSLTGNVAWQQKNPLDIRINGKLDLATLSDFNPDITASGFVITDATVRGPFRQPQVTGRLEMKDGSWNLANLPNGIYNANGVILFTGTRGTIQSLTGESGGGKISLSGFAGYEDGQFVFRLQGTASQVRVRYPEGVSTVADATLNWTGVADNNLLSGAVTILRTGFNLQSDFGSILAKSGEPVRTPAAQKGPLAGMHLDLQIQSSPEITFQSSLAQNVQAEANLRLRGTATNPALLGRININQGQIIFFGTKYTISQGSIAFYNPVKIEPILNVDLETKARGINVLLNVSGPINKLNLTPRSDPPLPFSEIVALLATGRSPTESLLASQQTTAPQTWQQMGASTLLGQAIANPVAGRLQKFFGITKLRIDPTLTGVEFNPQARLTFEQQVTQNITFTYITNVTSSNPQVVQVEWALNSQASVIAVRDENGLFGLDFFYKKRFK